MKTIVFLLLFPSIVCAQQAILLDLGNNKYIGIFIAEDGTAYPIKNVIFVPKPNIDIDKVTQVTYVYEKDDNFVPGPVDKALQALNKTGILASEFEEDNRTGLGTIPKQYEIALKVAKEAGLPALIVQSGNTVVKIVKDPQTEQSVLDSVK